MAAGEMQEAKMRKSVPNNQIKALAMAMGGATVAAAATMFVPVGILEGITGSTGLSELVPSAAAPLGDTARAMIAFGAGAFTLAILAYLLLRQDGASAPRVAPSIPASEWAGDDEAPSLMDRLARIKLPAMALPKMPWTKGESDITELADLPKLRNGDSHPDAPARRPLIASQDLPILDLAELPEVIIEPETTIAEVAAVIVTPEPKQLAAIKPEPTSVTDVAPTLADMVAQLEAAVSERQKQLAELEAVATELAASRPIIQRGVIDEQQRPEVEIIAESEIRVEPPRYERPPLEAVPSVSVKDDDMDSALAAALATLHRMNATGR
jgi:hypothetical protein